MTVIIGAISKKYGIVGSDSRIFNSAYLDNGVVIKPAVPRENDFDKTFRFKEGKIIGAFSGLMEFDNKYINEHIHDIIINTKCEEDNFDSLVEIIKNSLKTKIETIDNKEVLFLERILHVILISSLHYDKKVLIIYTLSFIPNNETNEINVKVDRGSNETINKKQIYKSIRGDDGAIKYSARHIKNVFRKNHLLTSGFIESLIKSALKIGISKSGIHKYGSDKTCGGNLNIKLVE